MQKYIRHSRSNLNHLLDGDTLVPGITCATEWTYDEGIHFIRSLPTQFQKDAFEFAHGQNEGEKIAMSLGQRTSLEEFFKLYKQYKPKLKTTTKFTDVTSVISRDSGADCAITLTVDKNTEGTIKVYIKGANDKYLAYSSSTNFSLSNTPYEWNLVKAANGTFRLVSAATKTRVLSYRAGDQNCFGPYSDSSVKSGSTEYFDIELFLLK